MSEFTMYLLAYITTDSFWGKSSPCNHITATCLSTRLVEESSSGLNTILHIQTGNITLLLHLK